MPIRGIRPIMVNRAQAAGLEDRDIRLVIANATPEEDPEGYLLEVVHLLEGGASKRGIFAEHGIAHDAKEGTSMATKKKKKATKRKATKKKATKKKATKRAPKKAAKKKASKRKATKKKATKKKATKRAPKKATKKKAQAPAWLAQLKRGDRFRELSNKQLAIYCGYEREGGGYVARMKGTGKDPLTYKITAAQLQKFFKPIATRKPDGKKSNGKGSDSKPTSLREREVAKWLRGGRLKY